MNVIATAKIIAVRIRLLDRPPVLLLIVFSPALALTADSQSRGRHRRKQDRDRHRIEVSGRS
jgi:hypothetical protein